MNRNEMLHCFILGFGLSAENHDLGRSTTLGELWQEAKIKSCDCDLVELLDALYTLPREYAALIKSLTVGDGPHPVSFERVRNTEDWPEYFRTGPFSVKVLPEGIVHYGLLSEQLVNAAAR
jgi:hypothetical protein